MTTSFTSNAYRVFAFYLLVLLTGYMFLDKGFAYVGIPPLYVSEIGLGLGVCTFLLQAWSGNIFWRRLYQPAFVVLILFLLWQAARTIPYFSKYGLDAARDAVLWGYAAYGILICLMIPENYLLRFFDFYRKLIPFFLVWQPVSFFLVSVIGFSPTLFQTPVPLITLKETDMGFHLASIGAFLNLQLHEEQHSRSRFGTWILWSLWWMSWIIYATQNRTAMFTPLLGIVFVILLRPRLFRWKPVFTTSAIVIGLFWASGFSVPVFKPFKSVTVSFQQLKDNIVSLIPYTRPGAPIPQKRPVPPPTVARKAAQPPALKPANQPVLQPEKQQPAKQQPAKPRKIPGASSKYREETIRWRVNFWKVILNYTLHGPYFWTGKGYGINLADNAGFANWDHTLRSPHNVFITFLGRSGVPGVLLWFAFLAVLMVQILKVLFHKNGDEKQKRLAIWSLACFAALILSACLDVFLEGPMAGIWFWSLVGFALTYFQHVKSSAGNKIA